MSVGLVIVLLGAGSRPAAARNFRVNQIPNGSVSGCANCHLSPSGGGARNAFGRAVEAITGSQNRTFWSAALAALDSDADGAANGVELGDPDGDGTPIPGAAVFNPGNANSTPPLNQFPSVALAEPAANAILSLPAVVTLKATANDTDGTVARVEFFDGAAPLGTVTASPFELVVDLAVGPHELTARATDDQGATTTSAAVSVTVSEPEPLVVVTPAVAGGNLGLSWNGGAGPFAVQQQDVLGGAWRTVGQLVSQRHATVPLSGAAGVLRVADFATVTGATWSVQLSGASERPDPVTTEGTGSGTLQLDGNTLSFSLEYAGLSGPATMAHIHGPATADETGGVLINLAPFNGGAFGVAGTVAGAVILTPDQKAAVLSGLTYVNFHTDAHPAGEIRGQLLP